jgi:pimeloyl-ACP methyl ester carboxylesterase
VLLLLDMGHQIIAPDLTGHCSERTPPASRPYEKYVPCVCNILDAQSDPVVLLGHSSGGAVISAVAEERREKISVLVYLAAFLLTQWCHAKVGDTKRQGVAPAVVSRH